jgi:hypothetical protein
MIRERPNITLFVNSGLYFSFMAELAHRRRTFMPRRDIGAAPELGAFLMDLVFIAVGAAMFALFAVYAVLLKGV